MSRKRSIVVGPNSFLALSAAIFLIASFVTGPASAIADDATADQVIPSTRCRGLWIVPLTFGEDGDPARTMQLVLDTGASSTSVDPDAIQRVFGKRIKAGKKVSLRDGVAGPLRVKRIKVRVHEMDHLARALGSEIDGIMGFNVFEHLLLTLDYHNEEVRVGHGSLGPLDGREIFEDLGKRRPYIALDFGDRKVPLLIDSGSSGGLDLLAEDAEEWLVEPRPVSGSVRYSRIVVTESGRIRESPRFGPLVLERPVVDLRDGLRLIGSEALERFELTFDQRSERIRMVPDSDEPIRLPPPRGIGAAMNPRAAGFEVIRIFDGLPAQKAGLRVGDMVVRINGVPTTNLGCERAEDDTNRDSTQFTIRRGDEEFELEVGIVELLPSVPD